MNRYRKQGFTLVEIMVSIALLMATVLAVMGVITNNAAVNKSAREREIAINAASEQMERIFRDLPQNVDNYKGDTFPLTELSFPDGRPGQVSTQVVTDPNNSQLRQVTVTVTWSQNAPPVVLKALRRTI